MGETTNSSLKAAAGLRAARAKAGLSQAELASKLMIAPSTLSSWENRGGFGIDDAWRLADFFGITLDELVDRSIPN